MACRWCHRRNLALSSGVGFVAMTILHTPPHPRAIPHVPGAKSEPVPFVSRVTVEGMERSQ